MNTFVLFFIAFILFILISLTSISSKFVEKLRIIAQEYAKMENRLRKLEEENDKKQE